jgi:XTP/dITP diphosphohydrolase
LLGELAGKTGEERRARFVCVITIARQGRALAVVSGAAEGLIASQPHGLHGFGYDPIFCFPDGRRTWAEATAEEKNLASHRGKAFRSLMALLTPVE